MWGKKLTNYVEEFIREKCPGAKFMDITAESNYISKIARQCLDAGITESRIDEIIYPLTKKLCDKVMGWATENDLEYRIVRHEYGPEHKHSCTLAVGTRYKDQKLDHQNSASTNDDNSVKR